MGKPAPQDHLPSTKHRTKKPVESRVYIALDSEIADRYLTAKSQLERARELIRHNPLDQRLQSEVSELEGTIEDLEPEVKESTATYVFKSMGRQPYEDLQEEHPATADQRKEARKNGKDIQWNPDTFPRALVVECGYEVTGVNEDGVEILHKLTKAEVDDIWDSPDWNQAEIMDLFLGALSVNQGRRVVDLGKGSR